MLVSLVGITVLAIVMLDVFFTVLDANGHSILSSRLYRAGWWVWRHGARMLPPGTRRAWLSVGAPLLIGVMIAVWMSGLVVGFALVYFGGMSPQNFLFGGGSQPNLAAAFRLSWVTLSTIGFVEISPSSMTYSLTVALQAILGGVVLTFTITYFLSVHQVVLSYNRLVTGLHHRAAVMDDPVSGLSRHFMDGRPRALDEWLDTLHDGLVELHEGLRRYPIVYYFQPRRRLRALPYTLDGLRRVTAGLRWCLPGDHTARTSPALLALQAGLEDVVVDLQDRYVPIAERTVARTVSRSTFDDALAGRQWSLDRWVARFLHENDVVSGMAGVAAAAGAADAYSRYREWLPFSVALDDFVRMTADDLGYGDDLRPGRSSSLWQVLSRGPKQRPQPLQHSGSRA